MDELVIGDKTYIPSKRAAEITGYAKDYIGQLCREGRVEARLVGRSWYVLESSIREHRFGKETEPSAETNRGKEEIEAEEGPIASTKGSAVETWNIPTYTPEPLEEVIPIVETTYVENTERINEPNAKDSSVLTMQAAWQDWFSRKQEVVEESEPMIEQEEPVFEEPIEEVTVEETHEYAVRSRHNTSGSMDIGRPREVEAVAVPQYQEIKTPRRKRKQALESGLIARALFIAFVLILVAISFIGSGMLESAQAVLPHSPIIDFIGGVDRIDKN